ncbi:prolipoprotein diacylglyceryl transferase [Chelatococcus sp. SYSU_G07232]|uniref:Phosphatidylglycerol--prolipoprotein diacylglyceryl transferase n=1 Tax=Chelatococcus albus TaxID=3047466 RepID=A0ABT7AIS8_9HYPH|nr:prolipoprotein diacylglyceryl transferase [Chelatococcus sp. SYSU_G07232]MDJ1159285.1 prolipoprotein diacylglyceryl transferase [Chelatococcus sp. SYSU_G07232]
MPLFAIPFPMIDPVIVTIGPFAIRWYALAYVAGLVGGWLYARCLVAGEALWGGLKRPTAAELDDMLVYVAFGVVLGGRLGYVLFYNFAEFLTHPLEIFAVWKGGMSFHGGLTGAAVAIWLFARSRGLPVLSLFDLAATVAPIGLFFGRIANFINGELWGRAAPDVPWAVVFPNGGPVPRHPSQLYEAFAEGLVLFGVVAVAVRLLGFRRPGTIAGIFGVGYALARSVCEFFREPDPQLGFLFGAGVSALGGGVTMGMVLSLPLLIAGLALILAARAGRTLPKGEAPSRGDAAA